MSTEITPEARAIVRNRLADLAVDYRVAAELGTLVDDKHREIHRTESQVREMLKYLGVPMEDGPFSTEAAERALARLEAGDGAT
jgi:uncharacterized protein YabE (DUF348 family)